MQRTALSTVRVASRMGRNRTCNVVGSDKPISQADAVDYSFRRAENKRNKQEGKSAMIRIPINLDLS